MILDRHSHSCFFLSATFESKIIKFLTGTGKRVRLATYENSFEVIVQHACELLFLYLGHNSEMSYIVVTKSAYVLFISTWKSKNN